MRSEMSEARHTYHSCTVVSQEGTHFEVFLPARSAVFDAVPVAVAVRDDGAVDGLVAVDLRKTRRRQ